MSKVKQLCFSGKTIYCGLDVHKTNWRVNARIDDMEIAAFSQNPDPILLKRHFDKNYPQAQLKVVYEAGFCGFGAQRSLTALGIDCIVVNAADVPLSDKDRKRKDDKRDARRLSIELSKGGLSGIYVPDKTMEEARSLLRQRHRLVEDQRRCANRVKHLLMSQGIDVGMGDKKLTGKYIAVVKGWKYSSAWLQSAVLLAIAEYEQIRSLVRSATVSIREMAKQEPFYSVQKSIQSAAGVGLITAMVIQTEIVDIYRFKTLDRLCDFVGLVPNKYSSGDRDRPRGISRRGNSFLKEVIIESSWILIRKDPAMMLKYQQYKTRMNHNKAIIRIGKHLLSRIRFLWKNNQTYVNGLM